MDLVEGGVLCCVGAGIESRETGMFKRLSGQRNMPVCAQAWKSDSTWFQAVRYDSGEGGGLVDPGGHKCFCGSQQRLGITDP